MKIQSQSIYLFQKYSSIGKVDEHRNIWHLNCMLGAVLLKRMTRERHVSRSHNVHTMLGQRRRR